MSFEFDPEKAAANLRKHGVSFAEAEPVFYDPRALTREDADAAAEMRFLTVGTGALGGVLDGTRTGHPSDFGAIGHCP